MKGRSLYLGLALILSALIVSGCGREATEATAAPTIAPTVAPAQRPTEAPTAVPPEVPPQVPNPAAARDAALSYAAQNYGAEIPAADAGWVEEDLTEEGLVGGTTFQYTAEDWVVTVSFPVVAPDATIYQVVATNDATGFQWEGEVDALGQVTEIAVTEGVGDSGLPVVAWGGFVVGQPEGAQFDDCLVLQPEGAGEIGLSGVDNAVEAQIEMLRDSGTYAHFWGTLNCPVVDCGGCELVVERLREDRPGPFLEADPVEGWEGTIVGMPEGGQFDDCFELSGDLPVGFGVDGIDADIASELISLKDSATRVRIWGDVEAGIPDAFGVRIRVMRIEVLDEGEGELGGTRDAPCWYGRVESTPADAAIDDYLVLLPEEAKRAVDIVGADDAVEAEIQALRASGTYASFWGTLDCRVPAWGGCRLVVTWVRAAGAEGPSFDPEPVEGWTGSIVGFTYEEPGAPQPDDAFIRSGGIPMGYGIYSFVPAVAAQLEDLRDAPAILRIWGEVICPFPDFNASQIHVDRLEVVMEASAEDGFEGWKPYLNEQFGYAVWYPGECTVMGSNLNDAVQFANPEWPVLSVSHYATGFYRPPDGTDLEQWITEHMDSYDEIDSAAEVAGVPAVHLRTEGSQQAYGYDGYYVINDGQLFRIMILHTGGQEDWDLYDRFLGSFSFE